MPLVLQDSLLACCCKALSTLQNEFAKALKCQCTAKAAKAKLIADKKLKNAEGVLSKELIFLSSFIHHELENS